MRYIACLWIFCFAIGVGSARAAAPTDMVFPVYTWTNVVNCRFWMSTFVLFNPHSTPTTVSFNTFDGTGQLVNSGSVSIDPFKNNIYVNGRTGMFWVDAKGSDSVIASEILEVSDGCPPPNPPGQFGVVDIRTRIDLGPATVGPHQFVNISYNKDFSLNTGLSIVFPSSGTASTKGMLVHRGTDGQVVSQKDVVIPANGQIVGMISDLLPDSLTNSNTISGSLEISFDSPVAVVALQFGWPQPLEDNVLPSLGGVVQ